MRGSFILLFSTWIYPRRANLSEMPFFLNFGYPGFSPFLTRRKKFLNANPKWSKASASITYGYSLVHGNSLSLMALNFFLREYALGFSPDSYWRFHSAKPQL